MFPFPVQIAFVSLAFLYNLYAANPVYGSFRSEILASSSFPLQGVDPNRTHAVLVPPSYASSPTRRYPSLYFLHGSYVDYTPYLVYSQTFLLGMQVGYFPEVIVVFPNGTVPVFPSSMWTNSALNGNISDYVVKELVTYIDANYRTEANAAQRYVIGNSAGGYGAMSMALRHPEVFSIAVGLSGPYDWTALVANMSTRVMSDRAAAGNLGSPVFNITDGIYTAYVYQTAAALSPNLSSPQTLYVDFPLALNGSIIAGVQDRWQPAAITHLVANSTRTDCMRQQRFYFDAGLQDEYFFSLTVAPLNTTFAAIGGVTYTASLFQGGHSDQIETQVQNALIWLRDTLASGCRSYNCGGSSFNCPPAATTSTSGQSADSGARASVSVTLWLVAVAVIVAAMQ